MSRLSSSLSELRAHYTVVVVGSGYGGAISAARLARAGQDVCVLERGREWGPGSFPRGTRESLAQVQLRGPAFREGPLGASDALLNVHVDAQVGVVTGCGLGGTSLINASVALRPDPRVFQDGRWPEAFRADVPGLLEEGYARAERMLRPTPYPTHFPTPAKLESLERTASALGSAVQRPPLCVTFRGEEAGPGAERRACNLCGDCVSGCNRGAKNDLRTNYLPEARRWGASLFTGVDVRHVAREGGRWRVHYRLLGVGRERLRGPELFLTADHVILSAGTLGSTEILLRSREQGLALSATLGQRFSGNGDLLAFGYNLESPVGGVAHGAQPDADTVGPAITGLVDRRDTAVLEDGVVLQEGVLPGALARLLPAAFAVASLAAARGGATGVRRRAGAAARALTSLVAGARRGALRNTQTLLVMSHDAAEGTLSLAGEALRIAWEGAGTQPTLARVRTQLGEAVRRLGGIYVDDPAWSARGGSGMVTVHPLGGCAMAEDGAHGVVDHEGRVFRGGGGRAVHAGLYICDGAVMPRALGVNPLLTIAAVAERFCVRLMRRQGWAQRPQRPLPAGARREPAGPGLRFTEAMQGTLAVGARPPSPLRLVVTAVADELEALLSHPGHAATLVGTVEAPALSPRPLAVTRGSLQLFVPDDVGSRAQTLRYALELQAEDGARFVLEGVKRVRRGWAPGLWKDTTTLAVRVWRGEQPEPYGVPLGQGVLRLGAADLARQLTTLQAPGAADAAARAGAVGRFLGFFGAQLAESALGLRLAQPQPPAPDRIPLSLLPSQEQPR